MHSQHPNSPDTQSEESSPGLPAPTLPESEEPKQPKQPDPRRVVFDLSMDEDDDIPSAFTSDQSASSSSSSSSSSSMRDEDDEDDISVSSSSSSRARKRPRPNYRDMTDHDIKEAFNEEQKEAGPEYHASDLAAAGISQDVRGWCMPDENVNTIPMIWSNYGMISEERLRYELEGPIDEGENLAVEEEEKFVNPEESLPYRRKLTKKRKRFRPEAVFSA